MATYEINSFLKRKQKHSMPVFFFHIKSLQRSTITQIPECISFNVSDLLYLFAHKKNGRGNKCCLMTLLGHNQRSICLLESPTRKSGGNHI